MYHTVFSKELKEAYQEGYKDAQAGISYTDILNNKVIFDLFCKQTARYLESISLGREEVDRHIEYLKRGRQ